MSILLSIIHKFLILILILSSMALMTANYAYAKFTLFAAEDASGRTEVELYKEAVSSLNKKHFKESIKKFQEVENVYPFSYWSMRAKLMIAFASYRIKDYASAAWYSEEYIQGYPNSDIISYAYYLRAMSNYMQIDNVELDQQAAYTALEQFDEMAMVFPDSKYTADLISKRPAVKDHIAAKEFLIAKSYLKSGKYVAGIKRLNVVYNEYSDTKYFPETLYRLAESYAAIGLLSEAQKYEGLLSSKFASSEWCRYAKQLLGSHR